MFSKAIRPDRLKDRAASGPREADRLPTIYESVGEAARLGLAGCRHLNSFWRMPPMKYSSQYEPANGPVRAAGSGA
jgi:hypothetical protein